MAVSSRPDWEMAADVLTTTIIDSVNTTSYEEHIDYIGRWLPASRDESYPQYEKPPKRVKCYSRQPRNVRNRLVTICKYGRIQC